MRANIADFIASPSYHFWPSSTGFAGSPSPVGEGFCGNYYHTSLEEG
jgi:hypothetical protein